MSQSKKRSWSLLVNVILILVAFSLLGLTIWSNRSQLREVLSRPLDVGAFGVAFVVYMIALMLTFWRWQMLVRALGLPFKLGEAVRLGFIGNVFNLVIPGAVGGDVIKAAYLCRGQQRKTLAVASMVIDRAVGLLGLFLLASISGAFAWASADQEVRRLIAVAWATTATGAFGLALLFSPAVFGPLLSLAPKGGRIERFLRELVTMASSYRERRDVVAGMLLLSAFNFGLFVIAFYLVSRSLFPAGLPSLGKHLLIVPLTLFTTAVPLPFGALGLSEQVSDQLFRLVGHPGGAVAMMAFRVLMYGGGLVSLMVYLYNLRQVRELSAEVEQSDRGLAEAEAGPQRMEDGRERVVDAV